MSDGDPDINYPSEIVWRFSDVVFTRSAILLCFLGARQVSHLGYPYRRAAMQTPLARRVATEPLYRSFPGVQSCCTDASRVERQCDECFHFTSWAVLGAVM